MARPITTIAVSSEDEHTLKSWISAGTTEQRMVFRAKIILACARGVSTKTIARSLMTRAATISKWRRRYVATGIAGLIDAPRPGKPSTYTNTHVQRVLHLLDEPPPSGYAQWNGRLIAKRLGDISTDQVWRIMRKNGIQLERRRSWCISTDPEFASKAADIVGIYLNPPENAVVLSVDEKPHIQALERAQGYLKFPNGRAMTGFSHEYKRHGTSTLFAALNVLTGIVIADHYHRRRRREFLDFMNQVVRTYPNVEIHVVLDNLNTHKPKNDRWLARHKNVHFHYTPTHASWLNQIEVWFSMLSRAALKQASFLSVQELRDAIDRFISVYNESAIPFEWTKEIVHQKHFNNIAN